ncbi:MAG TPA: PqqD family protein [Acidobacteriota bacterium]|nr:PqqD family protein [Acidobacteriota bacterium]
MPVDRRFLTCRFQRKLEWQELDQKTTIVYRPRFGKNRFGKWLAATLRLSDYRIRLDAIGTLVWKHCDGNTQAATIIESMRYRFGEQVEPAEDRLYDFVMQMRKARMIDIIPTE